MQSRDSGALSSWSRCVDLTVDNIEKLYELFNIKLKREDIKGESSYQEECELVVEDLLARGLAGSLAPPLYRHL